MSIAIHRYTEPGMGSVNAYWIETPEGGVVVDGQCALSQARRVRAEIERTGKPIVATFLTHPHPDHFGGLGELARGVPLYGSAAGSSGRKKRLRESGAVGRSPHVIASSSEKTLGRCRNATDEFVYAARVAKATWETNMKTKLGEVELRPMTPKMGPKPGAGE